MDGDVKMAWTYEIDIEKNIYPNLTIQKKLNDGVESGWLLTANDGYVMYRTNANDVEPKLDENGNLVLDENGDMILVPVIYYYRLAHLPRTYNWNNFSWVAVLESTVDGNYIFGGGDNEPEHEIM